MKIIYGKRLHRGGLQESISTSVQLTETEFKKQVTNYTYYGFDTRNNQILFINIKKPYTWLYIEVKNE